MWKVNDWCFCEFKLQLIKDVKNNIIREVSDGYGCLCGSDLTDRCFPLDLKIKCISEEFADYSDKIFKLNYNALNYPDIHRFLVDLWKDACQHKDDNEYIGKSYKTLDNLYVIIKNHIKEQSEIMFEGINLFKKGGN